MTAEDEARRAALLEAQAKALTLFEAIEAGGLIAAGRTEGAVQDDIGALAEARFGVTQHWHRRIVRAGANTLTTASDFPDERIIAADDTVYVDLGPVFEAWEADVGRTYAVGSDLEKHRLVADLPHVFERVQAHYGASPEITGAELYAFAQQAADEAGWVFGGAIAGHWVGDFPHSRWPGERATKAIWPDNNAPLRGLDHEGRARNWILEIHLVDRARSFGGFYEQLL
ncbi:MAG TPA: M24 family metallopeptidase [Caulobacteraceae bacterium]|jgi:Xaa-Pro aminopeptidase|nr:M24 family metallopeptidase [Caulobacteraceae bacterium]